MVAHAIAKRANGFRERHELGGESAGANNRSIFQQNAQQHLHPITRGVRHLQQAERMAGRRRVDDDQRILALVLDDRQHAKELVDPGWREVHQVRDGSPRIAVRVRPGLTEGRQDFGEPGLEIGAPGGERGGRVELADVQVRRTSAQRRGTITDRRFENVGERMRRIGGEQQHTA